MTDTAAMWVTSVYASYRLFGLHDPTSEESANYAEALSAASGQVVGWSTNAFMVEAASDLAPFEVQVEVVPTVPPTESSADLLRDGRLELPGGQISIPGSIHENFQVGVSLPTGPGTYGVRVTGYGRRRVQELRDAVEDPAGILALPEALVGVERYRISLWQISGEPRWPYDDEEEREED
jgi:hypothetical protein